jgi:predicted RNA-binding protein associated with RNAse of E/G family
MRIPNIFPPPNTAGGRSAFAQNPASVHFWLTRKFSTKSTGIRRKIKIMWNSGDPIAWRGVYKQRIWHANSTIVVRDSPEEIALAILPGAQCIAAEGYMNGKEKSRRRWDYVDSEWVLEEFSWRTNRLLSLTEPEKYYSTNLFWDDASNEFLCYYINFQLPCQRTQYGIDTLDLDLDLIIHPDWTFEWKDIDDYEKGIEAGIILPEWVAEIESAKSEVFGKLAGHEYPLDASWLDWKPETTWTPPKFQKIWHEVS